MDITMGGCDADIREGVEPKTSPGQVIKQKAKR